MIPAWIMAVGVVVFVLGAAYAVRNQINGLLGFGDVTSTASGQDGLPKIWWYVDDSQVNGRQWLDWHNRSTREPNEPYLKIVQAKAIHLWSTEFDVEPVIGRVAALDRLRSLGCDVPEGADRCPPALWMPWCRAAFLSKAGGLWLDGSVIPMGSATDLKARLSGMDALTFGVDPDEGLATGEAIAPAAGRAAGWAAVPGHPVWRGLERDVGALIGAGDQSWGAPEARRSLRTLWDRHCSGVVRVDRKAEVSRDRYGRRLELDVLLGQTEWVNGSTEGSLWVPLPDGRDALERASPWLWFLRMSAAQIHESEFVWARWATKV
jgi:hypothetical protein